MQKVNESSSLEEIKIEIEDKRMRLNKLVVSDINKDEVLKFSVELDKLIGKYYDIGLDKKTDK
jgi:hypothetical protein